MKAITPIRQCLGGLNEKINENESSMVSGAISFGFISLYFPLPFVMIQTLGLSNSPVLGPGVENSNSQEKEEQR